MIVSRRAVSAFSIRSYRVCIVLNIVDVGEQMCSVFGKGNHV